MKLPYVIGFVVLFLLFSITSLSAIVLGLRQDGKGDRGSVGDQGTWETATDAQEAIARTAQSIAQKTDGQESGPQLDDYKKLIRTHLNLDATADPYKCTPCNYFATVVMRESRVDPKFPGTSAAEQYKSYILTKKESYQTYALTDAKKAECNVGSMVDTPKRGDLLYGFEPGHVGVFLGNNEVASASIGSRSPKIKTLGTNFDCGARVIGQTQ